MRSSVEKRLRETGGCARPVQVMVLERRGALRTDDDLTPAAVLVPLVDRPDEMTVLLTRRTGHLRDHAGQVSFPGGRVESGDGDAVETALRETEEEVGLSRDKIEVVGMLDDYVTGTGFLVSPVVAFVAPGFELAPDPFEVDEVFEVPLAFCLDHANYRRERLRYQGRMREYFALHYLDHYIWGATAGMLANLCGRLTGTAPAPRS